MKEMVRAHTTARTQRVLNRFEMISANKDLRKYLCLQSLQFSSSPVSSLRPNRPLRIGHSVQSFIRELKAKLRWVCSSH